MIRLGDMSRDLTSLQKRLILVIFLVQSCPSDLHALKLNSPANWHWSYRVHFVCQDANFLYTQQGSIVHVKQSSGKTKIRKLIP